MGDRECVLRVLAFMRTPYQEYKSKNIDAFLNQCMIDLNKSSDSRYTGPRSKIWQGYGGLLSTIW